jgi:amino acid adenylation domain-containing protein
VGVVGWLDDWAARPYDLTRPPLSAALLRTGAEEHVLFLGTHHAAVDGSSLATVLKELAAGYTAAVLGTEDGLPPARQYREYADWYREQAGGETWAEAAAHWADRFRDLPPGLALPADRPRADAPSRAAGHVRRTIGDGLREALSAQALVPGNTPFLLLLAAYAATLHRVTDQRDVLVGAPVAARWEEGAEEIVGNCTTVLPVRSETADGETFAALLDRLREELFEGYEYALYPFSAVCRDLGVPADARRNSLFSTMFNLNDALPALRMPGLEVGVRPGRSRYAKCDLTVDVALGPDALTLDLEYDAGLFDARTVEQIADVYRACLTALLERPGEPVEEVPLLGDDDARELLTVLSAGGPRPAEDDGRPVLDLFEEQAAAHPERIAGTMGRDTLTYGELDARASRLARLLRGHGVGGESRVAVLLDRSLDMLVTVLGVWKAGGAFVPLDVDNPPTRWRSIAADVDPRVLLVHGRLREQASGLCPRTVVLDDPSVREELTGGPAAAPPRDPHPDDLAYVMFTSGSTGRPKGVEVTQRGLAHTYWGWERAFALRDGRLRTHLAMANFCFDVFPADVLRSLCSGARLVLCPKETLLSPADLLALVEREQVHFAEFVPVVLRALTRHAAQQGRTLAPFRLIAVSSDTIYASELAGIDAVAGPQAVLVNTYGTTETTIDDTCFRYTPQRVLPGESAPNRVPYAGTRAYVLGPGLRPLPPGVPGRLFVAGDGVARGYANRPAVTARRFVPDPWSRRPGARMYDTGDLARYRWEGEELVLDFFGRGDHQVKVRGYRVEPGEVESALRALDGVEDAVVVADPRGPDGTVLTAYLVPAGGSAAAREAAAGWFTRLREAVPDYMLPSRLLAVDALPVSSNGKLRRGALAGLPAVELSVRERPLAPRDETERRLAAVWEELLGHSPVGVRDEFFRLGGHSLLAMQVVARVRDEFGVEVSVREFLCNTTVERLAREVTRLRTAPADDVPLVPLPRDGDVPLPMSFMQKRFWFLDRLWRGAPLYTIPCVLDLEGDLDTGAVRRAWRAVVDRHEVLRCRFPHRDGVPELAVDAEQDATVHVEDLRELPAGRREEAAAEVVEAHVRQRFDLAAGPLTRTTLVRLGDRRHRLVFTGHHAVADFWSVGLLLRDFQEAYAAQVEGRAGAAARPPVQFADVADWQERWLTSKQAEQQTAFWQRTLSPVPPPLELPADRPRTGRRGAPAASAVCRAALPCDLAGRLADTARREGVTLFVLALTAVQAVLARTSGGTEFAVGTPVANRSRSALHEVVGPLINTVALRADLTGGPSLRTLLRRVRDTSLEAFAHQELPFDKVVEAVRPPRSSGRHPVFQVLFQYLPEQRLEVRLPGLRATVEELRAPATVFDLMLDLVAAGEDLEAVCQYDAERFTAATVAGLLDRWQSVLGEMTRDLDAPALTGRTQEEDR